jgi:hypothetical protein
MRKVRASTVRKWMLPGHRRKCSEYSPHVAAPDARDLQHMGSSTIHAGADHARGVMGRFYPSAWEMIQVSPEIRSAVDHNISLLLCDGLCITKGAEIVKDEEIQDVVIHMITPALARAYMWMLTAGYVVWAHARLESGEDVVFVPDPSQVEVRAAYHPTTGHPVSGVSWASSLISKERSILYMFRCTPHGFTVDTQSTLAEALGPLISKLNSLETARLLILNRIARPPILIQEGPGKTGAPLASSDVDHTENREIEAHYDMADRALRDMYNTDRVSSSINTANAMAVDLVTARSDAISVDPTAQMDAAIATPIENSFVLIASGMTASPISVATGDLDYNETISGVRAQITRMLGINELTGEVTPTQRMVMDALGRLATDMINVIVPDKEYKVHLMSRVMGDCDASRQLVDQGVISEEKYATLHPSVAQDTKPPRGKQHVPVAKEKK